MTKGSSKNEEQIERLVNILEDISISLKNIKSVLDDIASILQTSNKVGY